VTLSWTPPKDTGNSPITNYVVEMRPVGGFQWTVVNLRKTVAQPSYTVTGLKDETAYEFRVSAENKVGQSAPSDVSQPAKYGKLFVALQISQQIYALSWNSMGPTPTPTRTLGMRLSCNFVNGYTIAYRVQYTFTRVHARIHNGQPREEKRACPTVSVKSADFRARILARKSARMSVSVSVSVPWNLSYNQQCSLRDMYYVCS